MAKEQKEGALYTLSWSGSIGSSTLSLCSKYLPPCHVVEVVWLSVSKGLGKGSVVRLGRNGRSCGHKKDGN